MFCRNLSGDIALPPEDELRESEGEGKERERGGMLAYTLKKYNQSPNLYPMVLTKVQLFSINSAALLASYR